MQCRGVHITAGTASVFREPALDLGVRATEVMSAFYKALQGSQRLHLNDLQTFGGNTYGDLRLSINTFGGGGKIDIRADALIVELRDMKQLDYVAAAKEHIALCEDTLRRAIQGLDVKERLMRASIWLACDGGGAAVDKFLNEKGNAALKTDQGAYAALQKEFLLQFNGLDAQKGTRVGLTLQRSTQEGDLFVQFDHTIYGNPVVTQTVREQFDTAEKEMQALMAHVGLEVVKQDA